MRKQTFGFVATLLLGANVLLPVFAHAESLNELDKKESAISRQSDKISGELQIALNDVNEKYQEVNDIRTKISENEATLEKTKAEITETEQKIEQRKEAIAERMKNAQVSGMTDRSINALLESKDLGEFLNRAFAMSVIQNAEKTKVASLGEAKDKLTELKATQEKTQAQLKKDSQSLEAETTKLDSKMANLKQELAENKTSLEKISQDKEVEKARQAAEKAQKEQAEKKRRKPKRPKLLKQRKLQKLQPKRSKRHKQKLRHNLLHKPQNRLHLLQVHNNQRLKQVNSLNKNLRNPQSLPHRQRLDVRCKWNLLDTHVQNPLTRTLQRWGSTYVKTLKLSLLIQV